MRLLLIFAAFVFMLVMQDRSSSEWGEAASNRRADESKARASEHCRKIIGCYVPLNSTPDHPLCYCQRKAVAGGFYTATPTTVPWGMVILQDGSEP